MSFASPWLFMQGLEGAPLDALRRRFVLMTFGGGRWEAPGENWRMADILGVKGVPNRVIPWGPEWDHDWPTWREMLPKYLLRLADGDVVRASGDHAARVEHGDADDVRGRGRRGVGHVSGASSG